MKLKFTINVKFTSGIVITIFLLLGTILTITNINKSQDIKQHAAEYSLPRSLPILTLAYYPPDVQNPQYLDSAETGWDHSYTIDQWKQFTNDMISNATSYLNDASRYHGYKDVSSIPYLNFTITDNKIFNTPMPRGIAANADQTLHVPNYGQILSDINICDYVNNKGVREVWVYGYHSKVIVPSESRMSSKYGDIANDGPKEQDIQQQFRMPICNHSYTLYNFTYQPLYNGQPNFGNTIHDRMHQIENVIAYVEGPDTWPPTQQNRISGIFWGNYAKFIGQPNANGKASCGDTHYTPLAHYITGDYNANNPEHTIRNGNGDAYIYNLSYTDTQSNCQNWPANNYETISCNNWSCTDIGYYKWWMQNMPGYENEILYQGMHVRNWWDAFYDFDTFVQQGRTLFCTSEATCHFPFTITQPTAQPSATIPPSPTNVIASQPIPTVPIFQQTTEQLHTTQQTNQQMPITISLSVLFNGIETTSGNVTPPSTKDITICLYLQQISPQEDLNCNAARIKQTIQLHIDPSSGFYTIIPNYSIGIVQPGTYFLVVSSKKYARRTLTQPISITQTTTNITIPQFTLLAGDIYGDGYLNVVDYNILVHCLGSKSTSDQCQPYKETLDLNDDGVVDLIDLNILMRNIKLQATGNY